MCDFLDKELPKLGLAQKYIRLERTEAVYDAGAAQEYTLTVHYLSLIHISHDSRTAPGLHERDIRRGRRH